MQTTKPIKLAISTIACASIMTLASQALANPVDECLIKHIQTGDQSLSVSRVKELCAEEVANSTPDEDALDDRLDQDEENTLEAFTLIPHQPNFFMLAYDDKRNYTIENWGNMGNDVQFEPIEIQFQVSIKVPAAVNLFDKDISVWGAYTNRSFWQTFNHYDENSSFFRETNHEPELWMQFGHDYKLPLGFTYKVTTFGFTHQSNGQAGDGKAGGLSRSWNRLQSNFIFENGNLALMFKAWYRITESESHDDNPDLLDYLGHGELRLAYKMDKHTFSVLSRNNIESGFSKGAVEGSWSFPIGDYPFLKGYVQAFAGYGESLMDYNQYHNRLGLGISLSDFL